MTNDRINKWISENVPEMTGKLVIVTGANSGLGLEVSKVFAAQGANLIMACRNISKGKEALNSIKEIYPGASVEVAELDLADLNSVQSFVEKITKEYKRLDILCNNAGVMALPELRTKDGFEMQFGTNHLGHFSLTLGLLPLLNTSDGARVVNISSMAAKMGKIDFSNLNAEKNYDKWGAYGQSKLANLLFTFELQKRLQKSGSKTTVYSSHPGYSATNLLTTGPKLEGASVKKKFMQLADSLIATKASLGALSTIYAATSQEVKAGALYGPALFGMWGLPAENKIVEKGKDPETALKLWDVSEKLTGIKYQLTGNS